ncbi:MAG: acyl-CoA desaturase [Chitinophagales bacterium]|nr:acyl-CoA desaturase [Chitinophagales bacterium]
MALLKPIRFVSQDKSQFHHTLHARVDSYFKENNLSKHANATVVVKTIVLLSAYLLPLVLMLWFQPAFGWSLACWALMGVAMAGIGMSVMHDSIHGAYAANPRINELLGYSLVLLGGAVSNWKHQHNNLHHTFTNITHYDEDIADKPGLRFSPHTQVRPAHRTQWWHAIFIYGITTLYWVLVKDFLQFVRYRRMGLNKNTAAQNRVLLAQIIGVKIFYFSTFLGLPLLAGIPAMEVLAGFLLMHFICGLILTVIFQLAHTVEETAHPLPNDKGQIENEWALHQLQTTVNFSRYNRILTWYVGGLNFQVEHHLFPKICHVHYPKIANIVERTAAEFNAPYLEHKTFGHALRSHFAILRKFGRQPMDEMMG